MEAEDCGMAGRRSIIQFCHFSDEVGKQSVLWEMRIHAHKHTQIPCCQHFSYLMCTVCVVQLESVCLEKPINTGHRLIRLSQLSLNSEIWVTWWRASSRDNANWHLNPQDVWIVWVKTDVAYVPSLEFHFGVLLSIISRFQRRRFYAFI